MNACRLKSNSNVFWCCFAACFSRDLTMAMYHGSAPRDHQACLLWLIVWYVCHYAPRLIPRWMCAHHRVKYCIWVCKVNMKPNMHDFEYVVSPNMHILKNQQNQQTSFLIAEVHQTCLHSKHENIQIQVWCSFAIIIIVILLNICRFEAPEVHVCSKKCLKRVNCGHSCYNHQIVSECIHKLLASTEQTFFW